MRVIMAFNLKSAFKLSISNPDALVVEAQCRRIWRDGASAHFGPTKFEIIVSIICRLGHIISKDEICDHLWGHRLDGGPDGQWRTVDTHVTKIRKDQCLTLRIAIVSDWGRGLRVEDARPSCQKAMREAA